VQTVPEIWSRFQISKSMSRDLFTTPFDLIFAFLSPILCVKFEVSTFKRSRDMDGSQNSKGRSRDLFTTPF